MSECVGVCVCFCNTLKPLCSRLIVCRRLPAGLHLLTAFVSGYNQLLRKCFNLSSAEWLNVLVLPIKEIFCVSVPDMSNNSRVRVQLLHTEHVRMDSQELIYSRAETISCCSDLFQRRQKIFRREDLLLFFASEALRTFDVCFFTFHRIVTNQST